MRIGLEKHDIDIIWESMVLISILTSFWREGLTKIQWENTYIL